jgi:DNA primase
LIPDHSYWNDRGISKDTLSIFKGGVIDSGKMAERYVFPIFNKKEQIVGFSGRDLKQDKKTNSKFVRPKWKHIGDKSKWNYPLLNNVKIIREQKSIIVVESIGDMLSLWENGVRNTIVSFGVILSPDMLSTLTRMDPDKIFISFNDDSSNSNAGNEAAHIAKKKLLQFFDEDQITIKLPQGHNDFNEMHLKEPSLIKKFFNG